MKVYTRTGDQGETSLIGGTRVPKYDQRIEAYGTVDELISYIGLIRDQEIPDPVRIFLIEVQDRLMTCATQLAIGNDRHEARLPLLSEEDILCLEMEIDRMEETLPPLRSFILPGGNTTVSYCHIARTVCRRAERDALKIDRARETFLLVLKYLNRLSDYLFVLSRKLAKDLNTKEIQWSPRTGE